jgi:hypothetical protein
MEPPWKCTGNFRLGRELSIGSFDGSVDLENLPGAMPSLEERMGKWRIHYEKNMENGVKYGEIQGK